MKPIASIRPNVTDHALVRYMERVWGVDFEPIRAAILTEERRVAIQAGARRIHCPAERSTYVIADSGSIVSVVPFDRSPGPRS